MLLVWQRPANPGLSSDFCSLPCLAGAPADEDKSYWNQVASKLAEATSADELMSFHKWMPVGQDAAQAPLNADKVGLPASVRGLWACACLACRRCQHSWRAWRALKRQVGAPGVP